MAQTGAPWSYSFEGQKTDVPLAVDSATGPESMGQGRNKGRGGKGMQLGPTARNRRGHKGKRH